MEKFFLIIIYDLYFLFLWLDYYSAYDSTLFYSHRQRMSSLDPDLPKFVIEHPIEHLIHPFKSLLKSMKNAFYHFLGC